MNDFDKVKEKNRKDDYKGIIILSIVFLIAFALIVFAIIKLTNQYFDLKVKMSEKESEQSVQLTNPEEGKSYEFSSAGNETDIEKSEEELNKLSGMDVIEEQKPEQDEEPEQTNIKPDDKENVTPDAENKNNRKSADKAPEKPKATKKKTSGEVKKKGDYLVQILSLKSKADAELASEKLSTFVSGVYVVRADLGSKGIWYRVRCCKNSSSDYAKSIVDKIQQETSYKPIVLKSR